MKRCRGYARRQGLQVVITDHHEPQEGLPDAEAILNPKQVDWVLSAISWPEWGVAFSRLALRKALSELGLIDGARINLRKISRFGRFGNSGRCGAAGWHQPHPRSGRTGGIVRQTTARNFSPVRTLRNR